MPRKEPVQMNYDEMSRQQKRYAHNNDPRTKAWVDLQKESSPLSQELNNTRWQNISGGSNSIGSVYNNDIPVNQFLLLRRRIPDIIRRATLVSSSEHPFNIAGWDQANIYDTKLNGVSMVDIEGMHYPLTVDELDAMAGFFGAGKSKTLRGKGSIEGDIIFGLTAFAVTNKLKGEKAVPAQLRNLYDRVVDFLDYNSELFINNNLSQLQREQFLNWMTKGFPTLMYAVGEYLPAALGITPSSTMKALQANSTSSVERWGYDNSFDKFVSREYRKDAVPEDLVPYIQFSDSADRSAAAGMRGYYGGLTDDEKAHADEEATDSIYRTKAYFRQVAIDIPKEPQRRFNFDMPANRTVENVILTAQDRRTLIFIAKYKDGQHLTIDLRENGEYYGFPTDIINRDRLLASVFMRDLLGGFLDFVREKYPNVNEDEYARQMRTLEKNVRQNIKTGENVPEARVEAKWGLFGRLSLPFQRSPGGKAVPAERIKVPIRQLTAVVSREQIEAALDDSNVKVIDEVMQGIKDFEFGRISAQNSEENTSEAFVSVGGARIKFTNDGGKYYYFEGISRN